MGLERLVCSPELREQLGVYRACDYLEGCEHTEAAGARWVRPWRVSAQQVRVLGSCMAWHPGFFKRMARTTAGICLHFYTDASAVALAVRLDVLRDAARGDAGTLFGATVDGQRAETAIHEYANGIPGIEGTEHCTLLVVPLDGHDEVPGPGMVPLPGFGREHEVFLWLPYMRGCTVRELWCDGTYVHAVPARGRLLVLGDSLGQGSEAESFAQAWPALLAQGLDLELCNQSISGQVFQPDFVLGLEGQPQPDLVVVELGSNYRFEAYESSRMAGEATGFLSNLATLWPHVTTLVISPTAFDAQRVPTHAHSCFSDVTHVLRKATATHDSQHLVNGMALLGDTSLLADSVHPRAEGHRQLADRLCVVAQTLDQTEGDLRKNTLALLSQAPACTFGMAEAFRRGIAKPRFASEDTLLLELPGNRFAYYSRRREEGRAALGALCSGAGVREIFACGPGARDDAPRTLGFDVVEPVALLSWNNNGKVKVSSRAQTGLRTLDATVQDELEQWPEPLRGIGKVQVRDLLARGALVGAFEKDELVGFVGELPNGAISMPQVLSGHRNRGWAAALVSTKANDFIARGLQPWILVYPYEKSLIKRLHEQGFAVSPATEQCVVSSSRRASKGA